MRPLSYYIVACYKETRQGITFKNWHPLYLAMDFVIVTIYKDEKLCNDSKHVFVCGLALSNLLIGVFGVLDNIAVVINATYYLGICVHLLAITMLHCVDVYTLAMFLLWYLIST